MSITSYMVITSTTTAGFISVIAQFSFTIYSTAFDFMLELVLLFLSLLLQTTTP